MNAKKYVPYARGRLVNRSRATRAVVLICSPVSVWKTHFPVKIVGLGRVLGGFQMSMLPAVC